MPDKPPASPISHVDGTATPTPSSQTPPEAINEPGTYQHSPPSPGSEPSELVCPVCQRTFVPDVGNRLWCSEACRVAAWRRDRETTTGLADAAAPPRPLSVYRCDSCGRSAIGQTRCKQCGGLMRNLGLGGPCPYCTHPVAVIELLAQEVTTKNS